MYLVWDIKKLFHLNLFISRICVIKTRNTSSSTCHCEGASTSSHWSSIYLSDIWYRMHFESAWTVKCLVCRTFVWGNPGMTYLTNEAFKLSIHYGIVLIIYFMLIVCYLVRRKTAKHFTLGVPISHHDSYPPGLPATASPISAAGSRPRVPVAWKSMIWYRRWSCQH